MSGGRPAVRRARRAIASGLVGLAALGVASPGRGEEPLRQRLQSVVQELGLKRTELRDVKRDERQTTVLLSQIDEAMVAARRDLDRLDREIRSLDAEVGALRAKIEVDVRSLDELRQRVRSRLRALSRAGGHGSLRVLLTARSVHDLALRRALMRRVAAHDAGLLRSLQDGKAQLLEDQAELERRLEQQRANREIAASALDGLRQTREARGAALLGLGARRGALEARIEALRASQAQLQEKLWSRTHTRRDAVGLATQQGQLPWPLRGALERGYGKAGGEPPSVSTGWTLRAPAGQRVVAVADGAVVHAGFLRGYGLLVIVDHDHGFHTLYAHLSRAPVEVGQQVRGGETIGMVGDTESLDGAKLYFELRRGGKPLDPGRWLIPAPTEP